jgi:hypothetical protein
LGSGRRAENAIRDSAKAKAILEILKAHGWITPVEGVVTIDGVRCRSAYRLVREDEGQ